MIKKSKFFKILPFFQDSSDDECGIPKPPRDLPGRPKSAAVTRRLDFPGQKDFVVGIFLDKNITMLEFSWTSNCRSFWTRPCRHLDCCLAASTWTGSKRWRDRDSRPPRLSTRRFSFLYLQPDLAFVKVLSLTSENFELRIFEFIKTFFRATQGGKWARGKVEQHQ